MLGHVHPDRERIFGRKWVWWHFVRLSDHRGSHEKEFCSLWEIGELSPDGYQQWRIGNNYETWASKGKEMVSGKKRLAKKKCSTCSKKKSRNIFDRCSGGLRQNLRARFVTFRFAILTVKRENEWCYFWLSPRVFPRRSIFLKIDCGNAREGFWWQDEDFIYVAKQIASRPESLHLMGIYAHCGNSYTSNDVEQVKKVGNNSIQCAQKVL